MALLLQCLRSVRAASGDLDLLPPAADDASVGGTLSRDRETIDYATTRSASGQGLTGLDGKAAGTTPNLHQLAFPRPAANRSSFACGSSPEPVEMSLTRRGSAR